MEDIPIVLLRGLIIYLSGLVLLRVSQKRLLSREGPFDILLAFILGSTLSRGINGKAGILVTLAASSLLVILHSLSGILAFYFPWLNRAIKGRSFVLLKDGLVQWQEMKKQQMTEEDLLEALRLKAHLEEINRAKLVQLELNGTISVIPEKEPLQTIEVSLEEGVKTVVLQIK